MTIAVVLAGLAAAFGLRHRRSAASAAQRTAVLGAVTGVAWGFVAAVIKEFSSHLDDGAAAIFSNWSVYVLLGAGAASLLLASHALAAGPLAASQPGFTILDPLAASLLGLFLFGEHFQASTADLAFEALALAPPGRGRQRTQPQPPDRRRGRCPYGQRRRHRRARPTCPRCSGD